MYYKFAKFYKIQRAPC